MRTCNILLYAVFSTSLFFLYFRDLSVLSIFIFLLHWLQLFPLSGSNLRVDPDSVSFLSRLFELALPVHEHLSTNFAFYGEHWRNSLNKHQ